MPLPTIGYLNGPGLERIAALLGAGGVVVLPTDTMYGFHCAASCLSAVERIRTLKGRAKGSGFILLAADAAMVDSLVRRWPGSSKRVLSTIWPAALTAVLPARGTIARIVAPHGRVAVRVPANSGIRCLIAEVGEPIVSTSVNRSARPPMTRIADIRRSFPGLDAYVSRRGGGGRSSSTVVDFTGGPPRLVRAGRFPFRRIARAGMRDSLGEKAVR
jgi:L-threonylcarbamoyladenylate synthase